MKLLIVGGVAGGASAAARARRLSETAEIILFERGPDVSFANCGLPYHVGEVIADRNKLLVTTPDRLRERFRLDVRTRSEVVSINRKDKTVSIRDLNRNEEYVESYDKLILSPGAAPFRPPIPGVLLPNIFTLRNLADTDQIKKAVDLGAKSAVIIGGGFIGLELAENLIHRGVDTTLIQLDQQILTPFDREMTTSLIQTLTDHGVKVILGDTVEEIQKSSDGLMLSMRSGSTLSTQLLIFGIGVRPENQLAVESGLETGPRGGIRVNEYLETSEPEIYAAGDAIETFDFVTNERTQIPLAGPANRQGRIAAENALGGRVKYRGTQGSAIIGFFGKIAAMTGSSEKSLKRLGKAYRKVYIHPAHHAGYYPGAEGMSLKLIFDPASGKILGAQGVGGAGVDKRIDVLAVAIQAGMSVYDLEEMELCYAPQFGSAKDPVNMLGFVAGGLLRGVHPQVDVDRLPVADATLLDVRTATEYEQGHIPDSINIPVDELRARLNEIDQKKPVIAYCQVGQRGYIATRLLQQRGFQVSNLSGGFKTYQLFNPARK
jgi:NADPH-dependent 2,4-dienoyl-CoA reductase/sulfur reductase-like enzyme/rhodanese-related sulfurtransferase